MALSGRNKLVMWQESWHSHKLVIDLVIKETKQIGLDWWLYQDQ